MTRARVAVAAAGILTLLLLQGSLVGPALGAIWSVGFAAVSLPAVAVAAVAFVDGPAAGMSFGFITGLLADLGSSHPAGVFALTWMVIGLICGRQVDRHRIRHDAVVAGVVCGVAGAIDQLALTVLPGGGGSVGTAFVALVPSVLVNAALGAVVVAAVRRLLDTEHLRKPAPVYTDLAMGRTTMGSRRG